MGDDDGGKDDPHAMPPRTAEDKMEAIFKEVSKRDDRERVRRASNTLGGDRTVVVDSCEAVDMVEGDAFGSYFYPGLEFVLPDKKDSRLNERQRTAIAQVTAAVERVYLVDVVSLGKKRTTFEPPTGKEVSTMTADQRLREDFGFDVRRKPGEKKDEEEAVGTMRPFGGPQIRLEPFDGGRRGVFFEPNLALALLRNAVVGVWNRLDRKFRIRVSGPAGAEAPEMDIEGLYVVPAAWAWEDRAGALSVRDPAYLEGAVELARKNARPIVIGDSVRFWKKATDVWGAGRVVDIVDLKPAGLPRPTEIQFPWSHYWTSHSVGPGPGTLVPCVPVTHVGPKGDPLRDRMRQAAARLALAAESAAGDPALKERRDTMPCAAAKDSRDICAALTFPNDGTPRCEFVQDSCRRNVDVLLDRLRKVRTETIRKSEELSLMKHSMNRHAFLAPDTNELTRKLKRQAKNVWALHETFFSLLRMIEQEFDERTRTIQGHLDEDSEEVMLSGSMYNTVRAILRGVVGMELWSAAVELAREPFESRLRAAVEVADRPAAPAAIRPGDTVEHNNDKRRGTVLMVDGTYVDVVFKDGRTQKILKSEVRPVLLGVDEREDKRARARAEDMIDQAVRRALEKRISVTDFLDRSSGTDFKRFLHLSQRLREMYEGPRPCNDKERAQAKASEKATCYLKDHDLANSPLPNEPVAPWLAQRLYRAALEHVVEILFRRRQGPSTNLQEYTLGRIRAGVAAPHETNADFHTDPFDIAQVGRSTRQERLLETRVARRLNARYLEDLRKKRLLLGGSSTTAPPPSAGSDAIAETDMRILVEMRRIYDAYNAPLAYPGDYSAAVRLLRRYIKLCFVLAEEATESAGRMAEAEELIADASHKIFRGMQRRLTDRDVEDVRRQIARRLMGTTEMVIDHLVDISVLREVVEGRSPTVPEHLVIRVRDIADQYRVFEVILPGSTGDRRFKAAGSSYPYADNQMNDELKGELKKVFTNYGNTFVTPGVDKILKANYRNAVQNLHKFSSIESDWRLRKSKVLEACKPPSTPSAPRRIPRNRHAVRELLYQCDRVRQFLLENSRTVAINLQRNQLEDLFNKYQKLVESVDLAEAKEKWLSKTFGVRDSLYVDSIEFMRRQSYKIILKESLGSVIDTYIDDRFKQLEKDIEDKSKRLSDFLIFKSSERRLAFLLKQKVAETLKGHIFDKDAQIKELQNKIANYQPTFEEIQDRITMVKQVRKALEEKIKEVPIKSPKDPPTRTDIAVRAAVDNRSRLPRREYVHTAGLITRDAPKTLPFEIVAFTNKNHHHNDIYNHLVLIDGNKLGYAKHDYALYKDGDEKHYGLYNDKGKEKYKIFWLKDQALCLTTSEDDTRSAWCSIGTSDPYKPTDKVDVYKGKSSSSSSNDLSKLFKSNLEFDYEYLNRAVDYGLVTGNLKLEKISPTPPSPPATTPLPNVKTYLKQIIGKARTSTAINDTEIEEYLKKFIADTKYNIKKVRPSSSSSSSSSEPSGYFIRQDANIYRQKKPTIKFLLKERILTRYDDNNDIDMLVLASILEPDIEFLKLEKPPSIEPSIEPLYNPQTKAGQDLMNSLTWKNIDTVDTLIGTRLADTTISPEEKTELNNMKDVKDKLRLLPGAREARQKIARVVKVAEEYSEEAYYFEVDEKLNFVTVQDQEPKLYRIKSLDRYGLIGCIRSHPEVKLGFQTRRAKTEEIAHKMQAIDMINPKTTVSDGGGLRGGGGEPLILITPYRCVQEVDSETSTVYHGIEIDGKINLPFVYYDDPNRHFPFFRDGSIPTTLEAQSNESMSEWKHEKMRNLSEVNIHTTVYTYKLVLPEKIEKKMYDESETIPAPLKATDQLFLDEDKQYLQHESSYTKAAQFPIFNEREDPPLLKVTYSTDIEIDEVWSLARIKKYNKLSNTLSVEECKAFLRPVMVEGNNDILTSSVDKPRELSIHPFVFRFETCNLKSDIHILNIKDSDSKKYIQNGLDWNDTEKTNGYFRLGRTVYNWKTNSAMNWKESRRPGQDSVYDSVVAFRVPSRSDLTRILTQSEETKKEVQFGDRWYRMLRNSTVDEEIFGIKPDGEKKGERKWTWADAAAGAQLYDNNNVFTLLTSDDVGEVTRRVSQSGVSGEARMTVVYVDKDGKMVIRVERDGCKDIEEFTVKAARETDPDEMRKYLSTKKPGIQAHDLAGSSNVYVRQNVS